jgi:cytochrome c oxidase subunit II
MSASGPIAGTVAYFWRFVLWGMTGVFVAVMIALALAVWRRGREPVPLRRAERSITAALVVTTLVLFAYLVGDLFTGRAVADPHALDALPLKVLGHQWWWEIVYEDSIPARRLTTANEIHVPVGRWVHITLDSRDVIHSLWIPELAGKRDAVPARPTELWIRADTAGVYVGHCAEFCGLQHALMDVRVVAEPADVFRAWYEAQLQPSPPPVDTLARTGLGVLLSRPCASCHTVHGTDAAGTVGPDLTHLASRSRIAGGALPNTRASLERWITDPGSIKPGARMPGTALTSAELQALVAYLESLK